MAYPLEMDLAHFTPPLSQLKHMLPPPLLSGHEVLRPCCSHHPQPSSLFLRLTCVHPSEWCPSPQIPQLQCGLSFLLGGILTDLKACSLSPELRSTFFLRKPSLSRWQVAHQGRSATVSFTPKVVAETEKQIDTVNVKWSQHTHSRIYFFHQA